MVQAAASILYPAFKENVEAILPWTGIMKRGIVFDGLLRFMDQQRRNNFYFFQKCAAATRKHSSPFIPFENLGTLELGWADRQCREGNLRRRRISLDVPDV